MVEIKEINFLEMLKANPFIIKYMETQTQEICLAAVQQNEKNLEFVNEEFKQICIDYLKSA